MRKASALFALILTGGMARGRELEGICRDENAGRQGLAFSLGVDS